MQYSLSIFFLTIFPILNAIWVKFFYSVSKLVAKYFITELFVINSLSIMNFTMPVSLNESKIFFVNR